MDGQFKMLQLLNYTNIRMVEQNAKLTAEMKELAKQNAEQTEQGARQAESMAILAYDTKRDSEVMKAITAVTLVFLPATFVSVCPILCLELTTYPDFRFQTIFSMGFFNLAGLDLSCMHLSAYPCRPRRVIWVDMVDREEGRKACQPPCRSRACTSHRYIDAWDRSEQGSCLKTLFKLNALCHVAHLSPTGLFSFALSLLCVLWRCSFSWTMSLDTDSYTDLDA